MKGSYKMAHAPLTRAAPDADIVTCVRLRPLDEARDEEESDEVLVASDVETRRGSIEVRGERFEVARCFDEDDGNEEIFESVGPSILRAVFLGRHAALIAFGATGSGKTHTVGDVDAIGTRKEGVGHRLIRDLFDDPPEELGVVAASVPWQLQVLHIHAERVHDLLGDPTEESIDARLRPLTLREDARDGVTAVGATSAACDTAQEVFELLERAALNLRLGARHLDRQPHRAYVVCRLVIEVLPRGPPASDSEASEEDEASEEASEVESAGEGDHEPGTEGAPEGTPEGAPEGAPEGGSLRKRTRAVLTLCDLAGSEEAGKSESQRLGRPSEAQKLLTSLQALGNVISALAEGAPHVPFRSAALTRLLQRSLGSRGESTCGRTHARTNRRRPTPLHKARRPNSLFTTLALTACGCL